MGTESSVRLSTVPTVAPVASPTAARRLRILVVEDNLDVAESFTMLLELWGHEVRAAPDGLDALRVLGDFLPDVAFIDLGLPEIDGFELARRLRREPRIDGCLLVALSGYARSEDKQDAKRAGFDRHLTKPMELDVIVALLAARADSLVDVERSTRATR